MLSIYMLKSVAFNAKLDYPPSMISSIASRIRSKFSNTVFFSTAPLANMDS